MQIDFIGHKDPQAMEESRQRMNSVLLSAEFIKGTDHFKIELLDSTNIEITAGDSAGYTIITKACQISGDTIVITEGIEHAEKYMNTNKLLIKNDKILYLLNNNGNYDTSKVLKIRFSKIKNNTLVDIDNN